MSDMLEEAIETIEQEYVTEYYEQIFEQAADLSNTTE
jgi:hypothetical protein